MKILKISMTTYRVKRLGMERIRVEVFVVGRGAERSTFHFAIGLDWPVTHSLLSAGFCSRFFTEIEDPPATKLGFEILDDPEICNM